MTLRYDTVLLDADGTLFDFDAAEEQAFARTMQRWALPRTPGDYALYRTVNQSLWDALERGEITQERLKLERFCRLFSRLGLRVDCAAFNGDYLAALADEHALLPGALELCMVLAGCCRLFIATNGIGATQRKRLAEAGLAPYITDLFISQELGFHKPDPGFFDAAFAKLGATERSRAIILGDSLTSDMRGGRNAGIATCWYNPAGKPCAAPELCDYEIARLADFPEILGYPGIPGK